MPESGSESPDDDQGLAPEHVERDPIEHPVGPERLAHGIQLYDRFHKTPYDPTTAQREVAKNSAKSGNLFPKTPYKLRRLRPFAFRRVLSQMCNAVKSAVRK